MKRKCINKIYFGSFNLSKSKILALFFALLKLYIFLK